eukprot:TRINITY_DN19304_c0_g2_i1.p1 TRINITY_DN19304_c0_g2~~TRINITY_DN19304_c0_g2_i1.p1  ORF type:complete len:560 (+),score=134.37 TRINITY_DN19304_c0_g2_i1:64-1680(+)
MKRECFPCWPLSKLLTKGQPKSSEDLRPGTNNSAALPPPRPLPTNAGDRGAKADAAGGAAAAAREPDTPTEPATPGEAGASSGFWSIFFCCRRRSPRARLLSDISAGSGGSQAAAAMLAAEGEETDASPAAPSAASGSGAVVDADGARSPTLEALSAKKRDMVATMRSRLDSLPARDRPPVRHDLWLKRFLAHGKWNVDKAMKLYLEMETWRRTSRADTALRDIVIDAPLRRILTVDLIGFYPYSFDKLGRVVAWLRVGHVPWWRPLFEATEPTLRSQLWQGEMLDSIVERRAKETGVWRERGVVLVDLRNLSLAYFQGLGSSARARQRGAMQTIAQYYPGIVDKAYILHAPGFANKMWTVLKMFLSQQLMDKAVLVANAAEQAKMLQELGPENVPRELGGSSDTPAVRLPEDLMMPRDGWASVIEDWRPREILVAKGATHEELIEVPPGSRLRWQWTLLDFSINFEVAQRTVGNGTFQVHKAREELSFSGTEEPICGELFSPAFGPGIQARLLWDNVASRLRSKTVLLRLDISASQS